MEEEPVKILEEARHDERIEEEIATDDEEEWDDEEMQDEGPAVIQVMILHFERKQVSFGWNWERNDFHGKKEQVFRELDQPQAGLFQAVYLRKPRI